MNTKWEDNGWDEKETSKALDTGVFFITTDQHVTWYVEEWLRMDIVMSDEFMR